MYRSILIVSDGTALSEKAVKAGLRMARDWRSKVIALNVQPPYQPPIAGEVPAAFVHGPAEYDRLVHEASRKVLDEIARAAEVAGVACETVTEFDNAVHKAIVRVARLRRCDLIIMASHGQGALRGLLLGSETVKVLNRCQIPVLVHR